MFQPARLLFISLFFLLQWSSVGSAEPLRVGALLPLTGALAEYGSAAKNGIALAQEEFPDLFKEVEFIYEDDRYEAKMALSGFQKLKIANKIDLLYLWGISPAEAVAPVAEQQKVPVFAVTCQREIGKGKSYVVRFCYQGQHGGKVLIEHLRSKGYKKLGLVTAEFAFINTIIEGMRENLKEGESIEIVENYTPDNLEFSSAISKLKKKQFDAVGVFLGSGQISSFYRRAATLGFKGNTFGTDFFDSLTEVADARGGMDGAVFAAPSTDSKFVARYRARFGNDLQIPWAANAYDFALLVAKNGGPGGNTQSPEKILERLKGVQAFEGASKAVVFKNDQNFGAGFDFPVSVKKIIQNEIVELSAPALEK